MIILYIWAVWEVLRLARFAFDLMFAWREYRGAKAYPYFQYRHESSYWKTLLWVRSL